MVDISVRDLNKYYGVNHVIKNITFEIYSGEKVGLLGKNGSGKTTLFKIIAGTETFESGILSKANGKKIEMLDQIPVFDPDYTVEDILYLSFKEITDISKEMKQIEGNADPKILLKYGRLMEEYERLGGYDTELNIEKICNGMNITEQMRKSRFDSLSGGEKTRVNLARILLRDCDILLLDEPTNHLDLQSLDWLEKFLREFSGTIITISHDRAFLDNIIDRIIEIENGGLNFYSGNYTWYAEEKQRRYISQSEQYERQQKEIKRIEERAKWFVEQNRFTTKHHAILSRIDHMDKIEKPFTSKKITEDFGESGFSGKEIVSLDSVYKSYGNNNILNNITQTIYRNDRIALIGANGCGKTTLVKILMGEVMCDNGVVKVGGSTKIAYMPQIIEFQENDYTVLETLIYSTELLEDKARNILAGFHFKSQDVFKKAGTLSGGEKSRLKLCILMQNNTNFLILDEPTNHLDIESREWVEDAIYDFNGTILFISHDRYFLNKFADKIWHMGNGEITEYIGGFEEYTTKANENINIKNVKKSKKQNPPIPVKEKDKTQIKQQNKLKELEKSIAETETRIKDINLEIETTGNDYEKLNVLYEELKIAENSLNLLYDEWLVISQDNQ